MSALDIGFWEDTPHQGCVRGDATMARIFGLTVAEADAGVSWERFASLFHPQDLAQDLAKRRRVRDEGGLFAWEHRIVPAPGIVRWVLARGHFERQADGHMYGRGIVIDITDSRTDGAFDHPAGFLGAPETGGTVTEQMADHALGIWDLIRDLDGEAATRVRPLVETLLYELGRQIAASLSDPAVDLPGRPRGPNVH